MLTREEMDCLVFIKYLYGLASEQSRQAQPHASAAILTLHDSVEMFLHLACEHQRVNAGKRAEFQDYFGMLEANNPGLTLPGKQSMLRLNQARVGLKHHANRLDAVTITELTGRVGIFFEDNTPSLLGIDFSTVSLTSLVQHTGARDNLQEAEQLMANGGYGDALGKAAIAFAQLVFDFQRRASQVFGESPFEFQKPLRYESKLQGMPFLPPPDIFRRLR